MLKQSKIVNNCFVAKQQETFEEKWGRKEDMTLKMLKITPHILQVVRHNIMTDSQAPADKVIHKAC